MAADESIDEPEKIRDRVECINEIKGNTDCLGNSVENFEKLILLEQTNPVRELQTILRSPYALVVDSYFVPISFIFHMKTKYFRNVDHSELSFRIKHLKKIDLDLFFALIG